VPLDPDVPAPEVPLDPELRPPELPLDPDTPLDPEPVALELDPELPADASSAPSLASSEVPKPPLFGELHAKRTSAASDVASHAVAKGPRPRVERAVIEPLVEIREGVEASTGRPARARTSRVSRQSRAQVVFQPEPRNNAPGNGL
jgi:hypothetical protein